MNATALAFSSRALNEYLALRWLATPGAAWFGAYRPDRSTLHSTVRIPVASADAVLNALKSRLSDVDSSRTGLLLSGGIDSAILARLLPSGLRAYTIRFNAPGAIDESTMASLFAREAGLQHQVIDVTWSDYEHASDMLMLRKRAPLHPVEIGLHKAALRAASDGLTTLIVGNGADSTFGGLDKLLSRDWTFDAFVERYMFLNPRLALPQAVDVRDVFAPWARGEEFDTAGFLKVVHGEGVTQAFMNAIGTAGCTMRAPYEDLVLDGPLDLARIRAGESKYLLRDVFARLYPGLQLPGKIAFARPMQHWLAGWRGPRRPEFRHGLDLTAFSGEQRWLLWCLERFLSRLEALHG
jgi:asparagine synthetase B (glutamine-hydrolysing)